MPRAIWSGTISFGLVNVPVKLHTATEEKDVHFNQLAEKSGDRIKNKRVSEKTGREVDDDSGKGTNARLAENLLAGEYYVQVRHYNRASGKGNYSIRVKKG